MRAVVCGALAFLCAAAGSGQNLLTDVLERVKRPARVRSIDIDARLDRDGTLHVIERQRLLTRTGDGAARRLARSLARGVELHRVSRVEGEALVPLTSGLLDGPNEYALHGGMSTILWSFDSTPSAEESYQLEYSIVDVLTAHRGGYRFTYDVLPPTPYDAARATLTLDPAWNPVWPEGAAREQIDLTQPVEARPLLRYVGDRRPAHAPELASDELRRKLIIGIGVVCFILFLLFIRHEWAIGRFRFPPPPARIGPDTIGKDLLSLFPQLDQPGGTRDDLDVLARLIAERKVLAHLHSSSYDDLHLLLVCPRDYLTPDERKVVALLFGAESMTSTSRLRRPRPRPTFAPQDAMHRLTRVMAVLLYVALFAGSCFYTGLRTNAEITYNVVMTMLTPFFLLVTPLAAITGWWARRPVAAVTRAVILASGPAAVITALIQQELVMFPPALYVAAAALGVSTFADTLQAARSQNEHELRRRQRAIVLSAAMERRWNVKDLLRHRGLTASRSGFKPRSSPAEIILGLVAALGVGGAAILAGIGHPEPAALVFLLGIVIFVLAVLIAPDRRVAVAKLQAVSTLDPTPPVPLTVLPITEPAAWQGEIGERGASVTGRAGPFTWTISTQSMRLPFFSVFRSNQAPVDGMIVFRPLPISESSFRELVTASSGHSGVSYDRAVELTNMPVDDDRLLREFAITSTHNLHSDHLSPQLRATLIHLAKEIRSDNPAEILRRVALIAFNEHGTAVVSGELADSPSAVRELATLGLRVGAAVRPGG